MACRGVTEPTAESRSNLDFLVFRNGKIEIVKGTATKSEIDLTNFFVQADSFLSQEFQLLREDSLIINTGNIARENGEIQFIAIFVVFPEETTQADRYLTWRYPVEEGVSPSGQSMNLGEIMILSGSSLEDKGWDLSAEDGSPVYGGLEISNPHTDIDVEIKVLMVR